MKTKPVKLTIDNLDVSHSVTYEKMSDLHGDFLRDLPPSQPFQQTLSEPCLFSHLEQLFGLNTLFRTFSFFKFPKSFGRIRFFFRRRMIARICPDACLECIQELMDQDTGCEKEGHDLIACFEEIRQKEVLLREIQLKIISFQKS